ncbi:MAG: ABC transporter permease subunit [Deltaproteobacteria bacterium]|jgi:ABC-type transport system involved in multi-copper enzyme maturation permease subunit|nr:ABC transporter permease subunit [Deltaproteobacteria bacterium]
MTKKENSTTDNNKSETEIEVSEKTEVAGKDKEKAKESTAEEDAVDTENSSEESEVEESEVTEKTDSKEDTDEDNAGPLETATEDEPTASEGAANDSSSLGDFMNGFVNIWRKETRTFFYSPIAYIILGGFILLVSWLFFERFWLRNEADVRVLFSNLPLVFLLLTPLITMKMWAEERASGTQSHLFSLPVSLTALSLGKMAACLTLLSTALLFTLPYPIMADIYGNLDWGPVLGGYIAAFLLGGAYISIGLFISSITKTQIEAAFLTIFLAGVLYFAGEPFFTENLSNPELYSFLHQIGLGSRFKSIARGVLDIRDLVYYLSITAFFVTINVSVLRHRKWL